MKHSLRISGLAYSLRPVELKDAQFIIDTRLEDAQRNKFIHAISSDISLQVSWIEKYFARENDYYFVVENNLTGKPEGLIGVYDIENGKGEWGRWVLQKGSMAAIESLDLLCQIAFEKLNMSEIYSHTIENNIPVVSFHNSAKEKFRTILKDFFELNGKKYNAVEHYIDADYYYSTLMYEFQKKAQMIFKRNMKQALGDFEFHHIGYACANFEREISAFKMLGYRQKDSDFTDKTQGICGRFLIADNQPTLELLKNSEDSHTLDYWLNNKVKMYHIAYTVKDFDKAIQYFLSHNAKIIKQPELSTYFGKKICFFVLPNLLMIELIED